MAIKPDAVFNKSEEAEEQIEKDKEQEESIQLRIGDTMQKEIVSRIKAMHEEGISARAGWLSIRQESIRQYEGIKTISNEPWPGHSNISTMITTVACDLLHSKLFPMVWNENSITWEGVEEHDVETSEVNKVVMSHVLSVDMRAQDKVDDILHLLVVDGTVAIKELWQPYWTWITRKKPKIGFASIISGKMEYEVEYEYIRRERCVWDIRPLESVVFPFHADSTSPRWEDDAEYILDRRWYTLDDLRDMKLKKQLAPGVDIEALKVKMDELPEFTGTQKERQEAEGSSEATNLRKESHKLLCVEGYIRHRIIDNEERKQCIFLVVLEPEVYLSGKALHSVSRIGRRPWVIRPFIRRPGRSVGKGVPELVSHLHTALDAQRNQRIDAGNKIIGGGGFYRPASGTNPRRLKTGPATWIPVDDPKNDVYQPTINLAGLNWSAGEEKFIMELIERLTYLTPAMLGKETASRPTARGTLAVINQGEQKFGLIGRRVQGIICTLLTDTRQKYEENMPPEKWERIIGKKHKMRWPSPEYMAGMYECKMQLDLTATDMQSRRALATMMYQTMAFDPLVTQNPAFMWEVRAEYLRVHRWEPVEKYIGPQPPGANPQDADDIFTQIEQEQKPDLTKVNAATVLPRLMELKKGERYEAFTPEAKALFNDTIRKMQMGYIDGIQRGIDQYAAAGASPFQTLGGGGEGGLRSQMPQIPRGGGSEAPVPEGAQGQPRPSAV